MDVAKTHKLVKPLVVGDREVSEIKLREPNMGDLRGLNPLNLGVEGYATLFGKISDQPSVVFDKLPVSDGYEIIDMINDFLNPGQETTEA